jgi:hypothetical protein
MSLDKVMKVIFPFLQFMFFRVLRLTRLKIYKSIISEL